jgi:hypothetical protein
MFDDRPDARESVKSEGLGDALMRSVLNEARLPEQGKHLALSTRALLLQHNSCTTCEHKQSQVKGASLPLLNDEATKSYAIPFRAKW